MFKHEKQLFHPVAVERPNPQYAALLQEQLGGGNGELKAAMQYLSCLLYTSPSPRDGATSRMPSSA